ncbi:MAG: PAS domain-containing protein [Rubrimonas sp.]
MSTAPLAHTAPPFLTGGGEMGARIRAMDWSGTPLGDPGLWPQSLRSALSICLHSSFPTAIYWGPELRLLYNDAWAPIPAERHPWALGRPAAEVWSDIWPIIGPQMRAVAEEGESLSLFDQMLPMRRGGVAVETWWNYSFTPIRGEDGSVMGVFNQGNETTASVLARRAAQAEIDRLGRMFAQAPGAVAILSGPRHVFELVNPAYERLVGRGDLIGRAVAEALPEVVSQGFVDILDRVFRTGEPHVGRAAPVELRRRGALERRFVDFVFQPLTDAEGRRSGIFVQASDATDAAVTLQALRDSEAKFHAIVNSIDQMIWSTRPDGFHDYYNDRWYEFTGAPPGSTDGDAWNGVFHPEDQERAWAVWRRCLETGEPYHIEYRLRHRSGQYRWVIGRAQCVRNEDGAIVRWFGTCTDVHDLKTAEAQLAEHARILKILNRTGEAVAAEIDLDRVARTVVEAAASLTGAAHGAFVPACGEYEGGAPAVSTFPAGVDPAGILRALGPGGPRRVADAAAEPDLSGAPWVGLARSLIRAPVVGRNGAMLGSLLLARPEPDAFGERGERLAAGLAAQASTAFDNARLFRAAQDEIRNRMRQEAALRESERFARSVLQSSGDCVVVLDPGGGVRFINDSGRALLGVAPDADLAGATWAGLWPEAARGDALAAMAAALAGEVGRFKGATGGASGSDDGRWWDVMVTPVAAEADAPERLVANLRDVTDQRRSEEARQLLVRELNHRVKNLFAIASGMVAMTARTATSVEAMSAALRGRLAALARAHELIRPAISTEDGHDEVTDLRALAEMVVTPHLPSAASPQLRLSGPDVRIGLTAATSLAMILHELATNAAKYGALATEHGRLTVAWRIADSRLELDWTEHVTNATIAEPRSHGFGSRLARSSATGQLGGAIDYDWRPEGVRIALRIPVARLEG